MGGIREIESLESTVGIKHCTVGLIKEQCRTKRKIGEKLSLFG